MILLLICLATCLYLIYKVFTKPYDLFIGLGIKHNIPTIFNNFIFDMFLNKVPLKDKALNYYNKFSQEKVYGIFDFNIPTICVRDLDLIKKMFIKDYDHFTARRLKSDPKHGPLVALNVSSIEGEDHRDMRATISPIFSTGKIKQMYELISDCVDEMVNHLFSQNELKTSDIKVVDIHELFSTYAINILSSCIFGIKINSYKNRNKEFYKHMYKMTDIPRFIRIIVFYLPSVSKLLNVTLFEKEVEDYFRSLIFKTIEVRIKENIFRPDIVNLIMKLKNGTLEYDADTKQIEGFATVEDYSKLVYSKRNWSDNDLLAQCILFFVTGESSFADTLAFAIIELALSQDVQEKLYQEIVVTERKLKGNPINYETILSMKYLDMVLSEVMRKWPIINGVSRVCTKDYLLKNEHLPKMSIKSKTQLQIPIIGIHYDPKYFPNPEKFDPERFSNEKIHKIISGSYMPFGFGPRNCPASRFALLSMKRVLFSLIKEFSFETCSTTNLPLKTGVNKMFPDKKMYLGVRKRI